MQGSLFAVIAVVLILLILLIWMNVMLVRRSKGSEESGEKTPRRKSASTNHDSDTAQTIGSTHSEGAAARGTDSGSPAGTSASLPDDKGARSKVKSSQNDSPSGRTMSETSVSQHSEAHPVEVMESDYRQGQGRGKKVFDRNRLPYFLHGASVPEFDSSQWHDVFMRLSDDSNVMGWVAFHDDTAGASDREYEHSFLEVLRSYKRSVSSLQKEVGLSHVLETSVIGEEGKIWFLTGSQDHWFALFVDRNADVHEIAKPFMNRLLTGESKE